MQVVVQKILEPQVDLGRFRNILEGGAIMEIDSTRQPPRTKFSDAVDELLQGHGIGPKHYFVSFYMTLPWPVWFAFQNWEHFNWFRVTYKVDNIMVSAVVTGPLDLWNSLTTFLKFNSSLRSFGEALEKAL